MSATLGLDDSAYRQGIQNVQSETKKTVSSLSGEYSKAAKAVVELTRRYNESVGKTGKASSETKNLKTMLAQAEAQLKATTTALKAANNGMEGFASSTDKASGKSMASAIAQGTIMAGMFSKLGSAALSAAKDFISSGIEYNAQIEKYTTGLTNMLGSAEAAKQAMENIQQDAARTPFNVDSLVSANQYLISAGENASYARKTIMALGDAVSATGGGSDELNRMAQNLQQIANTGKASAIDIKQFAMAGINVYGILADYTGKSTAEVQKMTVSYDLLTQALLAASEEGGRYYNAMDTQSQTMNGRVSTLQDNVKQLAGLLTGDLSSGIGVAIGKLNDMVVAAQEAYKIDGWKGLIGEITGLTSVIDKAKSSAVGLKAVFDALKSGEIGIFHGDWDAVYQKAFNSDQESKKIQKESRKNWDNNHNGMVWDENDGWVPAKTSGTSGSSITTSPTGSTKKSGSKSTTETVIESISHTATTTAQNALGTVTTSIQTLNEKVKDSAGKIKDRVTTTTTETGKEMVNGVETTYKKVETRVNGTVTKVTKTYDDMSKTLLGTFTNVSEITFNGITTKVQQAVEKYADGSEHIKKTVTETGQRIGENGAETYEKIITYVDGVKDKVTETSTAIDKSVKATQTRIDGYLSGASGQMNKGVFGLFKSFISDAKNGDWGNLGLDFVNLIWGEVSQGQRETISKWANDALEAINEAYSGGGLSKAFETLKQLFGDGIVASADGVGTEVKSFGEIFKGLTGEVTSDGSQIIGVLTKIGTSMGGLVTSTGEGIAGLASSLGGLGGIAEGLGGVFTQLGSLILSNPEIAAIIAIVAGVVGLGIALFSKFSKKKDEKPTSHYESPFSKTGVYDSLDEFSTRAAMITRYTEPVPGGWGKDFSEKQTGILEQIRNMLDENLPNIGKGTIVLDGEKVADVLTPRMAGNIDMRMGVTVQQKARGV